MSEFNETPEANEMEPQITAFIEQMNAMATLPGEIIRSTAVDVRDAAELLYAQGTEEAAAQLLVLQRRIGEESINEIQILVEDQARLAENSVEYAELQRQIELIHNSMQNVPGFLQPEANKVPKAKIS